MTKRTYRVPDVSCSHCKMAIEKRIGAMGGVENVHVHVDEKTVDIAFDENMITEEAVREALADEGYPVAA